MDFWFARPPVSFVSMNLISRARWRCSVSGVGGVIFVAPAFVLVCVLVLSGLVSLALVGGGGRGGRGGGWTFVGHLLDFCWTSVGLLLDFCWTFAGLMRRNACTMDSKRCFQWVMMAGLMMVTRLFSPIALVQHSKCLVHRSGQSTDNLNPSGAREQGTGHGSVNPTNGMIL